MAPHASLEQALPTVEFYEDSANPPLTEEEFSLALSEHFSNLEENDPPRVYGMKLLFAALSDILHRYADVSFNAPHIKGACRLSATLFTEALCLLCEEARAVSAVPQIATVESREGVTFTVTVGALPIPECRLALLRRTLTSAGCTLIYDGNASVFRFVLPFFHAGETVLQAGTSALYLAINRFYLLLQRRP